MGQNIHEINVFLSKVNSLVLDQNWHEAEQECIELLTLDNSNEEARFLLGTIYQNTGKPDHAIEEFKKILLKHPQHTDTLNNLGIAYESIKQLSEATDCYRRTVACDSDHAAALYNLGRLLRIANDPERALPYLIRALEISPDKATIHLELGMTNKALSNWDDTIKHLQASITASPGNAFIFNLLGNTYLQTGELEKAIQNYRLASQTRPDMAEAYSNLGSTLIARGDVVHAIENYQKAINLSPEWNGAISNLLLAMNYISNDPQDLFQEHLKWSAIISKNTNIRTSQPNSASTLPHRIGFLSPDFRAHSVAYFLDALYRSHDREQFEFFCYSDVAIEDNLTTTLKSHVSKWRNIYTKKDDEVYELISKDKIELLIDLAGHTANNRCRLLTMKPAKTQATWLGYPNTTGLETVQYRITDEWADPVGISDTLHTEKLVRLPHGFLCFTPLEECPVTTLPPRLENNYTTFCSFNVLAKVSDGTLSAWCAILQHCRDSRLLLKSAGLQDDISRQLLLTRFEQLGINRDRIRLVPRTNSYRTHMLLYNEADIALDTFPYNGTTTTCESLWMGVPVVTMAGNRHASRVGNSILHQAGLPELVANDEASYISKAEDLSEDEPRLVSLRKNLRSILSSSSLCNSVQFTKSIERAFIDMITGE